MRYCPKCKIEYDTEKENCPVCGEKLADLGENEEICTEEIVATMTTIGLL
ncbi:MAG: hypothetical protein VB055_02655 [Oscillospiraceae bacterium]|nr:hypothetical protein [Oscillospiraceae bacterium]